MQEDIVPMRVTHDNTLTETTISKIRNELIDAIVEGGTPESYAKMLVPHTAATEVKKVGYNYLNISLKFFKLFRESIKKDIILTAKKNYDTVLKPEDICTSTLDKIIKNLERQINEAKR